MLPVLANWPPHTTFSLGVLLEFVIGNQDHKPQYPNRGDQIAIAVTEAWAWLENATLVIKPAHWLSAAIDPNTQPQGAAVSQRGRSAPGL